MKQLFIILIACSFCFLAASVKSQTADSNSTPQQTSENDGKVIINIGQTDTKNGDLKPGVAESEISDCPACIIKTDDTKIGVARWVLIYLPLILTIIFSVYIIRRLRKLPFNLAEVLVDDAPVELKKIDPVTNTLISVTYMKPVLNPDGTPSGQEEPVLKRSSSRVILLFNSVAALAICVGASCYFIYKGVVCNEIPDFTNLLSLYAGLLLGIIPYGIKQVTK